MSKEADAASGNADLLCHSRLGQLARINMELNEAPIRARLVVSAKAERSLLCLTQRYTRSARAGLNSSSPPPYLAASRKHLIRMCLSDTLRFQTVRLKIISLARSSDAFRAIVCA